MAPRTVKFDTSDLSLIAEMGQMYLNEHSNSPGISKQIEGIIRKCKNNAKTIKISSRKGKGRGLQYQICEDLSELIGCAWSQDDDNAPISSRPMGQHGNDIILRGEALKRFPFSVECKCSETLDIVRAFQQVQVNCIPGTSAIIIHKRKILGYPIVLMAWKDFLNIFRQKDM